MPSFKYLRVSLDGIFITKIHSNNQTQKCVDVQHRLLPSRECSNLWWWFPSCSMCASHEYLWQRNANQNKMVKEDTLHKTKIHKEQNVKGFIGSHSLSLKWWKLIWLGYIRRQQIIQERLYAQTAMKRLV